MPYVSEFWLNCEVNIIPTYVRFIDARCMYHVYTYVYSYMMNLFIFDEFQVNWKGSYLEYIYSQYTHARFILLDSFS